MSASIPKAGAAPPHVRLTQVGKHFAGVHALSQVSLEIWRGRVHALVGENGAGKSTLGKILAGVHIPDSGLLEVDGSPVHLGNAKAALSRGFTTIAQELPLVPAMNVIENVFLGVQPAVLSVIDRSEQRRRFQSLCERTGFDLPPGARVADLRMADCQKVAILAALARRAELIVMDEPTAALPRDDAAHLLDVVRNLADDGITIVYVSHFLDEVLQVADTVTVMKDGGVVRSGPAAAETTATLVAGMLGRVQDEQYPPQRPVPDHPGGSGLEVRGICRRGAFENVSFDVRPGEIVGLAGLVGSGRTEVARAIFGADRHDAGDVVVDGRTMRLRHPADAIKQGVALIPDNRKELGLIMAQSVGANVTLASLARLSRFGVTKRRATRATVVSAVEQVGIKGAPRQVVETLSGGNQQKVLFGRWVDRAPRVLVVDEPTRGVDVGAKRAIYDLLVEFASTGMAVLIISNENEELIGLCHRIFVMRRGRIAAELTGQAMNENEILNAAFGESKANLVEQETTS